MKGFPFAGKSPIKDRIRGWDETGHNQAHDDYDKGEGPDPHEGETDPSAFKQKDKKKEEKTELQKNIDKAIDEGYVPKPNTKKKLEQYKEVYFQEKLV